MANVGGVFIPAAPRPRPWGLLIDLADKVPNDRWLGGLAFNSTACGGVGTRTGIEFCDYDSDTNFPDEPVGDVVEFHPVNVFFQQECSVLGSTSSWLADLVQNRAAVEASSQIAAELLDPVSGNPSFNDGTDLSGGAVDSQSALAVVEGWLASTLHGGQGLVHAPPSAFVAVSSHCIFQDRTWFTPSGHEVVIDSGYEEGDPMSGRIYGTGPVGVAYTPAQPMGASWENFDYSRNIDSARAVVQAIALFDPCAVGYADFDLSLNSGSALPAARVFAQGSGTTASASIHGADRSQPTNVDWGD